MLIKDQFICINGTVHKVESLDRERWVVTTKNIFGAMQEHCLFIAPNGRCGIITDRNEVIQIKTSFVSRLKNKFLLRRA